VTLRSRPTAAPVANGGPSAAPHIGLVPLTRPPSYAASTWDPYYEALHPPCRVHWIVNWRAVPKWIDHATNLWHRRQELRRAYEAAHGKDPAQWPVQHPGVLLDFHAACLGCNWFLDRGYYDGDGVLQQPVDLARRHETPKGAFRGGDDRWMPKARHVPRPCAGCESSDSTTYPARAAVHRGPLRCWTSPAMSAERGWIGQPQPVKE
jgi:hypothetical protein